MKHNRLWHNLLPLAPLLLLLALVLTLWEPVTWWLHGEEKYDLNALREWIQEAKVYETLPDLVGEYLDLNEQYRKLGSQGRRLDGRLASKREEIQVHLKSLGEPITKMYGSQLVLFPTVYRLEVRFAPELNLATISWDSELPRQRGQFQSLPEDIKIDDRGAFVAVQYHLRVYSSQQYKERQDAARRLRLSGLGVVTIGLVLTWFFVGQRRQRERQRQRLRAEQQVYEAERLRLQEELRRQEAESRREEAERQSLELKSQLFANIGIMAGSYAHNIKNLLVRPNDLLSRCLEGDGLSPEKEHMLHEVRHTLGTVTERLQQILQTVRRDPTHAQKVKLDLNALAAEMLHTWEDLAREKWKLALTLEPAAEPLWIEGDQSHLQQALENLLFNARDATFEMRNQLREQARKADGRRAKVQDNGGGGEPVGLLAAEQDRRAALIAAAAWKGQVTLRTRRDGERAILEVQDNGIGMSEEVARRCMEAHFSTKRNNALFAGLNAGMGLGLSFVAVILEHHGATLTVESQPLHGATFRVSFPLAG